MQACALRTGNTTCVAEQKCPSKEALLTLNDFELVTMTEINWMEIRWQQDMIALRIRVCASVVFV
eukprot:m.1653071 g.1653071  ORF g.1653071 m.1653071 type:complete len:65 (-) comp95516_c0_seq1:160-354(-)